jgi:regulation of enolase protein 1 (concanavalin A-like superfamily)
MIAINQVWVTMMRSKVGVSRVGGRNRALIWGILAVALAALAADLPRWVKVVSPDRQFSVELPERPRTGWTTVAQDEGKPAQLALVCLQQGIEYKVQRITPAGGLPSRSKDVFLDRQRDDFVFAAGGRMTSERLIRLDVHPGRDFVFETPRAAGGKRPIQTRAVLFLIDQSFFVLSVTPAPGPGDAAGRATERFLGSLKLAPRPPRAVAAAKRAAATPQTFDGWGAFIDPSGVCHVLYRKGQSLSILVPGMLRNSSHRIPALDGARVMREVEGDFTAVVKVAGNFRPEGPDRPAPPTNGAGLMLWLSPGHFIRLERRNTRKGEEVLTSLVLERRSNGRVQSLSATPVEPGDLYLRFERQGQQLLAASSADGVMWTQQKPVENAWPAQAEVGVCAMNSGAERFTAVFEGLEVTQKRLPQKEAPP